MDTTAGRSSWPRRIAWLINRSRACRSPSWTSSAMLTDTYRLIQRGPQAIRWNVELGFACYKKG